MPGSSPSIRLPQQDPQLTISAARGLTPTEPQEDRYHLQRVRHDRLGQRRRTRWLSICSGGSYFVGGYCPLDGPRGQSPRTRGGHNPKVKEVIRARSIPAHAGRTRKLSGRTPQLGQSPRTRGGRKSFG